MATQTIQENMSISSFILKRLVEQYTEWANSSFGRRTYYIANWAAYGAIAVASVFACAWYCYLDESGFTGFMAGFGIAAVTITCGVLTYYWAEKEEEIWSAGALVRLKFRAIGKGFLYTFGVVALSDILVYGILIFYNQVAGFVHWLWLF